MDETQWMDGVCHIIHWHAKRHLATYKMTNLKGGNMICDAADRGKKSEKSKHTDTHQKIDMWYVRD